MFCWILISLLVRFLEAQEIVIYAQVGNKITLPREALKGDNVYVNWYRGSDTSPTIARNPQKPNKGSEEKMRFSLLSDFSLQISSVDESDFTTWRCEQHSLTSTSKQTYRLYHVTISKVPTVLVNDSLDLKCTVEESSVHPVVTWISPNIPDCSQSRKMSKTISLSKVSICDNGVWTCQLLYEGRSTTATTKVNVIDLSPSSSVYTSLSSKEVNIPCSLSSKLSWSILNETGLQGGSWTFTPLSPQNHQKPPQTLLNLNVGPVVKWDVAGGASIPVSGGDLKDEDLSIRNLPVTVEIRGVYTCSLKFKTKTFVRKVNVEVLEVLPAGLRVYEGQGVNLSCSLGHENTSDLKVKWKHPSSRHTPLTSTPHPFVLSIPEVEMKDSGRWMCELTKNDETLTSAGLSLKIEKAPVDIWLLVAITSGVVVFILLVVCVIIGVRRYKQRMMYRRRKTRFCCCKSPQPKGFYKT